MNREMPSMTFTGRTPWPRPRNFLKKEQSIVGEGIDLTDKTIALKQCTIGQNCKIGTKSKLNNCIIMDNVTIGEG
jgi:ADP-glucose pyrophosphorylase